METDYFAMFAAAQRPDVSQLPWMRGKEFLLGTKTNLVEIEARCLAQKVIGLDTEATGLDTRAFPVETGKLETMDKIVGFCIAPTTESAYYIPVRHSGDGAAHNVPPRLVVEMLQRLSKAGVKFVLHGAKYDIKMLMYDAAGSCADWVDINTWEDTNLLAYLRDSRGKNFGLKHLSKVDLDREMIEIDQLFPRLTKKQKAEVSFMTLDPSWDPVLWYACADAMNTLALYEKLYPIIHEPDAFGGSQRNVYKIEKAALMGTIYMEQCRIYIDRPKLIHLIRLGQKEWFESLEKVYSALEPLLGRDASPMWFHEMKTVFDPNVLEPDYMGVRERCIAESPPDNRPGTQKSMPMLLDPTQQETVMFPYAYDITIPEELGLLLRELRLPGLIATEKSGQVKTSKDVLESLFENVGDDYPWMKSIRRFREVAKALSNTLFRVYWETEPEKSPDGCIWVGFRANKVDTGRFSTPQPGKKEWHGQSAWNVHSCRSAGYDPADPPPECVYRQREIVAARPPSARLEAQHPGMKFRLHAIDFSGVELRIVTNLSGEQKWLKAFFECSDCKTTFSYDEETPAFCPQCGSDKIGDLHSVTALSLYDVDPVKDPKLFKAKRKIGKIVNFLLCYGGSGKAVDRSVGCGEEEGWRIARQFQNTYKGLTGWWKKQHATAKRQKYVTTFFGRKYPVPDIDHENGHFRSKAERNAVNGPVQGTSADIMKYAMGLLYRAFLEKDWVGRPYGDDLVYMTITIHDELVFEIHDSIAEEANDLIEDIMCKRTVAKTGWVVKLKVDNEFGSDWTVPNNLTEMTWNKGGKWTPELAAAFPRRYAHYLSCGGVPVDGEIPEGVSTAQPTAPTPAAPVSDIKPGPFTWEFLWKRTATNAERLGNLLRRAMGRGMDELTVVDAAGRDLLGRTFNVAHKEFIAFAEEVSFEEAE